MSRCFPFPLPGYEAKPRSEHKDLLKKIVARNLNPSLDEFKHTLNHQAWSNKCYLIIPACDMLMFLLKNRNEEKHTEKKHKKERKDKGKRERKERGRDHRKDKHNKKHKREKHGDKRKNKERDQDKRRTLDQETKKNGDLDHRRPKEVQNEAVKDSKPTDELFTQIIGQEGHADHAGSSTSKLLPRSTECFGVVGSKEKERFYLSRLAEKSGQTTQCNHASEKGKDTGHGSKTRIQNGKSIQVGLPEKHSTRMHGSNVVGLQRVTTSVSQENGRITPIPNALQRTEQVGQHSDGSSHSAYGKSDSISTKGMMEKDNESTNNFHTRMDQQLVRGKDGRTQGKSKIKEVNGNHHKGVKEIDHDVNHKGVKDRDRDADAKKRKARGKSKDKEKEKKGVVNELKHKGLDAHGASKDNIHDLMDSVHLNEKFTSGDVKKRKDLEANISRHEHSMRMTKLPRKSPANRPCVNGETLKHFQGTAPCSSTVADGTNTHETDMLQDSKECCTNGITGSHYLEEHKASVSSSGYNSNEVSVTPPHPDTKYLSQGYSIPTIDDCSEYIDQDWLFSGDHVQQKTAMFKAAESPQVWAEAQPINCANIVALPYVIPL